MKTLETGHDELLSCALRDGVIVVTLEQSAFKITMEPKARDVFLTLLSEVEQMESVKALLVINSSAYPDVDRQREFLATLTRDTGTSRERLDRLFSVVANTRYRILERLIGFRKLVVSAMQGDVASTFFGLSLGFSLRVAADDTVLRFSRSEFDLPPSWPLSLYLPRYVGQGRAADILLSGKPLKAARLAEIGLVHQVFPMQMFEDRCVEYTAERCHLPGSQITGINRMLSPDPSEISKSFKTSLMQMRQALHSARRAGGDGMAPLHC